MRKAFLVIPVALVASLTPSISNADVPTCFGQPATIVGQPGEEGGDYIVGTNGPDVIVGTEGEDYIFGFRGDDLICGMGGGDDIRPRMGNDKVDGGDGGDGINGEFYRGAHQDSGNDLLLGGPDDDDIQASTGEDTMDGGEGEDTLSYYQEIDAPGPVTVDLPEGKASGWGNHTVRGFETVFGSFLDDTLIGDSGPNLLSAGPGNDIQVGKGGDDWISDSGGDDILVGGPGDDRLSMGNLGNDTVRGGEGVDTLVYGSLVRPEGTTLYINLAEGIATGYGVDSEHGVENAVGSHMDDILIGDSGPNVLYAGVFWGMGGQDVLVGRGGKDQLIAANDGTPDDSLDGGRGRDTCQADEGDEVLSCFLQP
jgi:Ca2+-binding RTX toxin-like protein